MNRLDFQKAINKYGIILSIQYTISLAWSYYFRNQLIDFTINKGDLGYGYIAYVPTALDIIFNIVFAILIYKDFKSNNSKSPLIVIMTLLFGFIGIVLFFIQVVYQSYVAKSDVLHQQD